MKLSPRDAAGFLNRPDPRVPGLLIYGADAMRVALKRQDGILALVGPDAEAEMRLSRSSVSDSRQSLRARSDLGGVFSGR